MELIQAYLEKTNQETIHVYGSKGNTHLMSIYLNQRQRPLPRPAFVPEGFTQREDGMIVPIEREEKEKKNNRTKKWKDKLIQKLKEFWLIDDYNKSLNWTFGERIVIRATHIFLLLVSLFAIIGIPFLIIYSLYTKM